MEWLTTLLSENGPMFVYIGTLLVLVLCGIGIPLPEEATFLAAGYACAKVSGNVWILCVVGVVGIMGGDSIPFWVGRKKGMNLLKHKFFARFLPEKRLIQVQDFFKKHGAKTVFVARFVAGLRMPAFFMAGTMGVKYRTFFMYDLAGALISCPTSIWLAYTFGPKAEKWLAESHVYLFAFLGVIVLYVAYHIWAHREKKTPEAGIEAPVLKKETLPPAPVSENPEA